VSHRQLGQQDRIKDAQPAGRNDQRDIGK